MKIALVTPGLCHLPFHPGAYFGYGAAALRQHYRVDVIDLNAASYDMQKGPLEEALSEIDHAQVALDHIFLDPLYRKMSGTFDGEADKIPWRDYHAVYITTPSWFVTVPTSEIQRLAFRIKRKSSKTQIVFFGNSIGTWTESEALAQNGIQTRHLNDLFNEAPTNAPVDFDALPAPVYENRDQYLFDLLPFRLKHGCIWGKCKFCSLARGWNAGYLERSARKVLDEIALLIARYDPGMFVCRDNALNGGNLLDFCEGFADFKKPWAGMARADLSTREIGALQRSGCRFIYFGLESGSERVLAALGKGITVKQMSRFIKTLHDHGILPAPSLFVGAPGETESDFQKTVRFVTAHREYLKIVNLYPYMPSPASDFSIAGKTPHGDAIDRLQTMIGVCAGLGLKVCVGEQCAEYALFKIAAAR